MEFIIAYLGHRVFVGELLLGVAHRCDPTEQFVRLDEESRAQQEGEEVRSVRIVVNCRHHVLDQSVQRARHQVAVSENQCLNNRINVGTLLFHFFMKLVSLLLL